MIWLIRGEFFTKNLRPTYEYFLMEDYSSLTIAKMVTLGKKYETIKEDEKNGKSQTRFETFDYI